MSKVPLVLSHTSPIPPGNNHGKEFTNISFEESNSLFVIMKICLGKSCMRKQYNICHKFDNVPKVVVQCKVSKFDRFLPDWL